MFIAGLTFPSSETETDMAMTMSVGRDYRTSTRYEYVIFADEKVLAREGFYTTYAAARRAGHKKANELQKAS